MPRFENDRLVSVIIPMYNCAQYFDETIGSVIAQTYTEWEAICVDDHSTDDTLAVARSYAEKDSRITVLQTPYNAGGPSLGRNIALERASGRYIAYLDADDVWMPDKLEKQIAFLANKPCDVCITSYQTVESDGTFRNNVFVPERTTYKRMLCGPVTCAHSILIDCEKVDKSLLVMPDIRYGQDFATWLNVMKHGHDLYGMSDLLAKYRKHEGSVSSEKVRAAKQVWMIYRDIEHLSVPQSVSCFVKYAFRAVKKRVPQLNKSKNNDG